MKSNGRFAELTLQNLSSLIKAEQSWAELLASIGIRICFRYPKPLPSHIITDCVRLRGFRDIQPNPMCASQQQNVHSTAGGCLKSIIKCALAECRVVSRSRSEYQQEGQIFPGLAGGVLWTRQAGHWGRQDGAGGREQGRVEQGDDRDGGRVDKVWEVGESLPPSGIRSRSLGPCRIC